MDNNIIIPVIIPNEDPEYCPSCHLAAEKKTVDICLHCKYEYPADDDGSGCGIALFVIIGVSIVGMVVVRIFAK